MSYPLVAVGVLVFAIIAEGLSFLGCVKEINKVRHGRSLWQWFRDTRQSDLLVIFGEDFAALLGLMFALLAIGLAIVTANPVYDAIGSIGIGVLLIVVAAFIGVEVKALLIGQGVEAEKKAEMVAFLEQQESITKIFNLVSLQLGSDVMVALKAHMVVGGSSEEMIQSINKIEAKFREQFPEVVWLFFEPDSMD